MYKLIKNILTDNINSVLRIADNACIPFDPQNSDYIAYLKWIEEGNTALPAEENQ